MIATLVSVLIYLLILGLVYWALMQILGAIPLPEPIKSIARVLIMVIIVIMAAIVLMKLVGPLTALLGSLP